MSCLFCDASGFFCMPKRRCITAKRVERDGGIEVKIAKVINNNVISIYQADGAELVVVGLPLRTSRGIK